MAVLMAILMAIGVWGCVMDDEEDFADEVRQEGQVKPPLQLTVCFEGKPCPGDR